MTEKLFIEYSSKMTRSYICSDIIDEDFFFFSKKGKHIIFIFFNKNLRNPYIA